MLISHFSNRGFLSSRGVAAMLLAALCLAPPMHAQSQAGRLLATQAGNSIVECNADGSNCFTVVSAASRVTSASISNGGAIAFDALDAVDGSCVPGGQGICRSHVFVMDADGTNVRQVTFNPVNPADAAAFGGDNSAVISPDGTMVAFLSNRTPAYDSNNQPSYLSQIYLVNSDGSGLRQLTFPVFGQAGSPQAGTPFGEISSVAWSPDSKKLAFKGKTYGSSPCGLFFNDPKECRVVGAINTDGTGPTYLVVSELDADSTVFAIDWSSSGSLIAYGRSPNLGDPAVAIIDLSGQGRFAAGLTAAQLGNACSEPQCIHFSPDSTRLAYGNAGSISTINLDGTGRVDTGVGFGGGISGASRPSLWWTAGTILTPSQLTLEPDPVEIWPGFSQQLTPSLFAANANLILRTAASFDVNRPAVPQCGIQIGPYGLAMFSSGSGNDGGSILAGNASLTSNTVLYKCWPSAPCTYVLVPGSDDFAAAGGSGAVFVDTETKPGASDSTCPWRATSNASWIAITSGSEGRRDGDVHFTVAVNTGAARQGTITVAGQTFTVNQDAAGTSTANLGITKTAGPNPVTTGSRLTYTIGVSNAGPSEATGVGVSDSLPNGVTFVSATPSQGSCTGTSAISCSLGSLASGGSATVTIIVTPTQAGSVSNTASVSANETDPNTANNSATAVTTVNAPPSMLTAAGPAVLWIGQNDSVKQLKFDLLAEVLVNGTVVASGQLPNVSAGGSDFSQAVLDTFAMTLGSPTAVPPGAALALRASVRMSCSVRKSGTGGVARFWFNGQPIDAGKPSSRDAGSRFNATIDGTSRTYFARAAFALQSSAGTSRQFVDVAVNDSAACPARPFAPFGTWNVTLP